MACTLEWFGATTFRLRVNNITIFLDTWLEKPSSLPKYLTIADVKHADYICISHAHFDHLPGADRLAIKTGAIVIANGEAINCLRAAGVPDEQLLPCSGGERIPLFDRETREKARRREVPVALGPPGAPPRPDPSLAALAVHTWPSLHCLMPGASHDDIPKVMDTGKVYTGAASEYVCGLDITMGMKHGLLRLGDIIPSENRDQGLQSFIDYLDPSNGHVFSHFDGGQLGYNFLIGNKALFWNGHLGAYGGLYSTIEPKPDLLIQAIAGRANLNGRPYDGSAAQFAVELSKWLGEPREVVWCLHDDSLVPPHTVDVRPATELLESATRSRIRQLAPGSIYKILE